MINPKEQIAELHVNVAELTETLSLLDAVPEDLDSDLQKLVYKMSELEGVILERVDIDIPNL